MSTKRTKGYRVEQIWPEIGKGTSRGWKDGYRWYEAVEFIAEIGSDRTGKITFDGKEVLKKHKDSLIQIANTLSEVQVYEKTVAAGAAQRERQSQQLNRK